ncbi:S1C family serine protease [Egicoccus halophilus]|uniref:PDZ domain-containing protein n=1 Tax=Egicoccus halophilus TaxID=1670830 RepID=A0A8J3AA56_9ACTN|nr:trypsin-like peptidase domain-containing protein [Egicoccus halophilus]GGI08759.1 hypothetical protein GCM10011354_30690 [Egicoccus halophilus]
MRRLTAAAALGLALVACDPAEEEPDPVDDQATTQPDAPVVDDEVVEGGAAAGVDLPELVREVAPSTVAIEFVAQQGGAVGQGAGSGVVWDAEGHIVTNAHVVEPAQGITVVLADGSRYPAEVVASDVRTDLAVLRIEPDEPLPPARFAQDLPEIGALALALGNPLGFQNTATSGIVSGVERSLPTAPDGGPALVGLIQTDAAISSGNSGGALVDAAGTVMGINVAVVDGPQGQAVAQGLGFAIPSTTVLPVVEQLIADGVVAHPYLGIQGVGLTPQLAERFGIGREVGVLVGAVEEGAPAAEAGLTQGDVIVAIEGEDTDSLGDLLGALRQYDVGESVTLSVVRNGEEQEIDVTLDELPDATG